jgi:hypothetical protein
MPARRFPPPWSVEELDARFVVGDPSGQAAAGAKSEPDLSVERFDLGNRSLRGGHAFRGTVKS